MNNGSSDNVVPLRQEQGPSREGWSQQEQAALSIARLAAMPALQYERVRRASAKEIGCRVSWLDRTVGNIRQQALKIADEPPPHDGRTQPGWPIPFFQNSGRRVMSFLVAACHRRGKDWHLVVLADGDATWVLSTPLSDERAAELERVRRLREIT